MDTKNVKILIVGGGIGGFALAAYLQRHGFSPVLIEKCNEWKTIGYMISLFPSGMRILEDLGVAHMLKQDGKKLSKFVLRDNNGKLIWSKSFSEIENRFGPVTEVERELLHTMVREAARGVSVRLNTTIERIDQKPEGVLVMFNDGKEEQFDLVVGADGIHSGMRRYVRTRISSEYSGCTFWLMWLPYPKVDFSPDNMEIYFCNGKAGLESILRNIEIF